MKSFKIEITIKEKRVPVPQKSPKIEVSKTVYNRKNFKLKYYY